MQEVGIQKSSGDAKYLIRCEIVSERTGFLFSSKLLILRRKWWNWQTHHLEGVAPKGVGVQIPPSAPIFQFAFSLVILTSGQRLPGLARTAVQSHHPFVAERVEACALPQPG